MPDGLEAVVFTADGDMRQALNNMQATHSGFGYVNQENVFKVCDQPHPQVIADMRRALLTRQRGRRVRPDQAFLYAAGFSAMDIIGTVYRVAKNYNSEAMPEFVKLEMIREIGFAHMRVGDGVNSLLQMAGLCAKLCKVARVRPRRGFGEVIDRRGEGAAASDATRRDAVGEMKKNVTETTRPLRCSLSIIQNAAPSRVPTPALARRDRDAIKNHNIFISARLDASYVRVRFMCVLIPSNSTLAWLALRLRAPTILSHVLDLYSGAANALASPCALAVAVVHEVERDCTRGRTSCDSSRSSASAWRSAHCDPRCCIWWYNASISSGSMPR